jgi:bifunctional polynucleotide phosphatase/kinase
MPLLHALDALLMLAIQDSTLVTPASGKRFGRDASDWKWWHSSVPGKLKQLYEKG